MSSTENPLFGPLGELRTAMEAATDSWQAEKMASYMQDRFEFYGIQSGPRRALQKPILAASAHCSAAELVDFALVCWDEPKRELHYTAVDVLRKRVGTLGPDHLEPLSALVHGNAWWDTIDALAAWVFGLLVRDHRELQPVMDDWIRSPDLWVARTAMLHQLGWKADAEADRIFSYALIQADHQDFFMRKAIGWALRQLGRTEPDAVRAFVDANTHRLSGLSQREALKRL